jgi:hypothetical protein
MSLEKKTANNDDQTFFEKYMKIVDIYGKPIEFTIGGATTFKTAFGGIMTLATFAVLGVYFVYKCIGLADRTFVLTNAMESEDLLLSRNNLTMNEHNFQIAIVPEFMDEPYKSDSKYDINDYVKVVYGTEEISQISNTSPVEYKTERTEYFGSTCVKNDFRALGDGVFDKYHLSDGFCPSSDINEFVISGQWSSEQPKYFFGQVKSCEVVDLAGHSTSSCAKDPSKSISFEDVLEHIVV